MTPPLTRLQTSHAYTHPTHHTHTHTYPTYHANAYTLHTTHTYHTLSSKHNLYIHTSYTHTTYICIYTPMYTPYIPHIHIPYTPYTCIHTQAHTLYSPQTPPRYTLNITHTHMLHILHTTHTHMHMHIPYTPHKHLSTLDIKCNIHTRYTPHTHAHTTHTHTHFLLCCRVAVKPVPLPSLPGSHCLLHLIRALFPMAVWYICLSRPEWNQRRASLLLGFATYQFYPDSPRMALLRHAQVLGHRVHREPALRRSCHNHCGFCQFTSTLGRG